MNLIFRRCSIGILSGAAASTALTVTPHHALWNFGGQHGEQDRYVELRRFLRLHWQYRAEKRAELQLRQFARADLQLHFAS